MRQWWRAMLVLALVAALSGCGREASSVSLGDGGTGDSEGERSMNGEPDDTSGGMAPGEGTSDEAASDGTDSAAPAPAEEAPQSAAPRAPASTRPAPAGSGTSPASPGGGGGSEPNQGIAVGEPNPANPDGCPECTTSSEPIDPSATPEPRPQNPSTEPRPGTDNPRAREWESAQVHADDVTITLTWWSGVEPCTVLDRVEVDEQAGRVVITIYEGSQPGFDGACTAQAVQKHTDVKLRAPLKGRTIVDGAKHA